MRCLYSRCTRLGHTGRSSRLADLDLSLHQLSNEADWRLHLARKVASREAPHYFTAKPRHTAFLAAHGISGVPRYVLVDREGRLLIDKLQAFKPTYPS